MQGSRRFLPSVTALLCFEAVARLGATTQAAEELSLTQSAVSRQIKALEDQLGVALFLRKGRRLSLTDKGQTYAGEVRGILQRLRQASVAARTDGEESTLNLSILPAFGMHWLAPRLSGFARRHPEVTVNLSTRLAPFDFTRTRFDAAIHFGRADWPGALHLPLIPETVVAVCAPALLPAPASDPRDLLRFDLLHLDTRPRGWQRWLAAQGVEAQLPPGMVFDQFATMAQAAVHGLGIALLPDFLAETYLASGTLVLAFPQRAQSIGAYFLVWPKTGRESRAPVLFRDWLAADAG